MNIMQIYEKMFSTEVRLMTLIRDILNAEWNDETNSIVLNGTTMEWTDHEVIDLPNEVELDEDSIDSILFFGDGTIEYHYKNEQDAFNWGGFSEEVNEKVIEQLKLVWHNPCSRSCN
jgi:hypothetical protein